MTEQRGSGRRAYAIVLAGALLSLSAVVFGAPTEVAVPIAGLFLLLGAALRGLLPDARAGWLAVRAKSTDVATLGLLGALLVFAGLVMLVPREWIIG